MVSYEAQPYIIITIRDILCKLLLSFYRSSVCVNYKYMLVNGEICKIANFR